MSIEVHHGGVLKKVGNQNKYIGGTVSRWDNIDEDTMSWFELRSMLLQVNIVSQYMVFQRQTQYDILIDSDVKVMNMLKNLQVDKKITLYIVHLDHKTADEDFLPDYCLPDNVNAPEIEITSNHEITPHALVAPNSEVVAQNSEVALYASNPNNYEVQLAESEDDFEVAKDVSGLEADDEVNDSGKSRGKKEVYGGTECDPQIEVEMEYEKSDSLHTPSNSDFEEDDVTSKGKVGSKDVTSGPTFNEERDLANPMLEVGMEFTCPADFRLLLRHYACVHGYDLKWSKNEGRRITVECKGETCKFRAFGSWNKDKTIFVLKSLRPDHNCSRVLLNKQMSSKWLAKKYLEHFRVDRSMKFDVFRGVVLRDFGVGVSKQKFYRAKSIAFDEIDGKILDQFKRLRDYAFVLLETNPGSHVVLKTKVLEEYNNAIGFEAIFISFAPMIRGLLNGCRPVIGLDGCHLSSIAGGILLTAVSRDPNNQMFPVAYAVVQAESKETWSWFIQTLLEAIGVDNVRGWTFISDRQKGLVESLKDLVPMAHVRFCVRHLYANFKDKFKGLKLKNLLFRAARAYQLTDHNEAMEELKLENDEAFKYLDAINRDLWARSHFNPASKVNSIEGRSNHNL